MGKKFPSEDLFLLPKIIKSLEGHVWCPFYKDVTKKNIELAHELRFSCKCLDGIKKVIL